jgi:hypothetical protein
MPLHHDPRALTRRITGTMTNTVTPGSGGRAASGVVTAPGAMAPRQPGAAGIHEPFGGVTVRIGRNDGRAS